MRMRRGKRGRGVEVGPSLVALQEEVNPGWKRKLTCRHVAEVEESTCAARSGHSGGTALWGA